jgi:hypothetical protein
MFTNEFEDSYTITTVIDETDTYEDIQLIIDDDRVIIQQDTEYDTHCIVISYEQWYELLVAINCGEGSFITKARKMQGLNND